MLPSITLLGAFTLATATSAFAPASQNEAATEELRGALQRTFADLAESGLSGAVLVARGDELLLDAGCGLADRARSRVNRTDSIFDVGSITKQFTAAAILKLEEADKLATTDTIARFFGDVPADKRGITIHHLLTHTSGLPPDVPVGSATVQRDALVRACLSAKLRSKPGAQFVYNNVGYYLLAAIVEVASDQSFESYVAETLYKPAAMSSSGFLRTPGVDTSRTSCGYDGKTAYTPAENGWYSWGLRGGGGALSTTGDLWRWLRALQTDAVLASRSREKLFKPFLLDYAYGWWNRDDPVLGRVITHGGKTRGFEGSIARYADHDLYVIVLCNDIGRCDAAARTLALVAAGKRSVAAPVDLSPGQLEGLAGEYEPVHGGRITVRIDGGALLLEPDADAVRGLVTSGAKLEKDARLAKRADKLIEAISAGDDDGMKALVSSEWPNWSRRLIQVWTRWIDARGELEKSECLGSSGSKTLVRLVHERRSVVWVLTWKGDVLNGYSIDGQIPEAARYRARSRSEFVYDESEGPAPKQYTLSFECDSAGAARALSFAGPFVQLKAKRVH